MATVDNLDVAGIVEAGSTIVAIRCQCGEARQHIDLSQRERSLADASRFSGYRRSQLSENAPLDLGHFLLCIEHFRFVIFELRRGEPLSIHQRLFALKIRRSEMQISL